MSSQDFNRMNIPNEFSVLAGARHDLGANKCGARVLFRVLSPFADAVYLVGSFNNWSESNRLERNQFGVWQTSISAEEIKDGDKYKFKIYSEEKTVYITDPYAKETDGEPYFNSVYRENSIDNEKTSENGSDAKCGIYPLNIYGIHAAEWFDERETVDFAALSDELLPYLLQMGYTHVSISGIPKEYGGFDNTHVDSWEETDREQPLSSFVRALHSAYIGVLVDLELYEDAASDIAPYVSRALCLIDTFGIDGFIINYNDAHGAEFFAELVHTVKSKREGVNVIVKATDGRDIPFADATVMESGAYRKFFRQKQGEKSRLCMTAAAITYLLFKKVKMQTLAGYEVGCEYAFDTFRRGIYESEANADFQFFYSELCSLYLSCPEAFGYGDGKAVSVEFDYVGIRVIERCSAASGFILAADFSGEGGNILLRANGKWDVLFDSTAKLCKGSATVRCEEGGELRLSLPPYGAVILGRTD